MTYPNSRPNFGLLFSTISSGYYSTQCCAGEMMEVHMRDEWLCMAKTAEQAERYEGI